MPTFLDGAANLAALTVPGVYSDIILPQPFLLGQPTNIEGLVGVGSWGPLNALIPVSKPIDCATSLGVPINRNADIASYVAAASQVGGQIGFYCVRVSDGTDVAATLVIPACATGNVVFTANPIAAATVTINGQAVTWIASGATGTQVNVGATLAASMANLMSFLVQSANSSLAACNYSMVMNSATSYTLYVNANASGTGGNSFTLATNVVGATASGSTLAGGNATGITLTAKYTGVLGNAITSLVANGSKANSYLVNIAFPGLTSQQYNNVTGSGNALWVAMAAAINSGNASQGASTTVVATAGSATGVPPLATLFTMSGGTDGASGVTDATLMGQDVVPRKGMYALRGANVDMFTLCDMASVANYAACAAFALSETCYAVFSTPSGDTIASALTTRLSTGIDTPWFKLILGDYPTFYDSFNGISRLINPSAYAIGIYGNLSPQQSALNKPLQGISATQRSQLGQTYSEAELSLINTGGLDVILAPTSSPGGNYYSFATGRNASSNTAANGDEYTRMTNFLTRASQTKAAGSFIGQTQSIQPNDQTRANAKALFDGFSQQLASPQVGLGINGQGMIDTPWLVQCDLNNNPANLQALGYLFLYWTVRYLNVIRYFVVKFSGGGSVTVSSQSTAPTPSQFAQNVNTTV